MLTGLSPLMKCAWLQMPLSRSPARYVPTMRCTRAISVSLLARHSLPLMATTSHAASESCALRASIVVGHCHYHWLSLAKSAIRFAHALRCAGLSGAFMMPLRADNLDAMSCKIALASRHNTSAIALIVEAMTGGILCADMAAPAAPALVYWRIIAGEIYSAKPARTGY